MNSAQFNSSAPFEMQFCRKDANFNPMVRTLIISTGLCGLTALAGTGLSMAQDLMAQTSADPFSTAFESHETPLTFALDQGVAQGEIVAPAKLPFAAEPDSNLRSIDVTTADIRPVARVEAVAEPVIINVTFAKTTTPDFDEPVSRDLLDRQERLNPTPYAMRRTVDPKKLKDRALIGVYR